MSDFSCSVRESSLEPKGHSHAHAHILFAPYEPLLVKFEDSEIFITPSQLGFVEPYKYHHCLCNSGIIIMNIPEEMIKKEDLEILANHPSLPLTGNLVPLVEMIKNEIEQNPRGDAIRYLFYYLYTKLVETNGFKSLRYIREHYSENISIAELAAMENYNASYFTDWFKNKTGWSPSVYLRNFRIEKAKELLVSSDYRLIEIAMQIGYSGSAAFSKAFKESEGISPLAYRRKMKKASV